MILKRPVEVGVCEALGELKLKMLDVVGGWEKAGVLKLSELDVVDGCELPKLKAREPADGVCDVLGELKLNGFGEEDASVVPV